MDGKTAMHQLNVDLNSRSSVKVNILSTTPSHLNGKGTFQNSRRDGKMMLGSYIL